MKLEGLLLATKNRELMLELLHENKHTERFWKSRLRSDLSFSRKQFLLGLDTGLECGNVTILLENKFWNILQYVNTLLVAPEIIDQDPLSINKTLLDFIKSVKEKG